MPLVRECASHASASCVGESFNEVEREVTLARTVDERLGWPTPANAVDICCFIEDILLLCVDMATRTFIVDAFDVV